MNIIKGSTQGQSNEDKDLPTGISTQQNGFSVEAGTEAGCSGLRIQWEERRCGQTTLLRSLDEKRRQEIVC